METIYISFTLSVGDFLSCLIQGCQRSQGSLGTQGNSENFKFTENFMEFIN